MSLMTIKLTLLSLKKKIMTKNLIKLNEFKAKR